MNDSLAWLRDPKVEHALHDLLSGLIRDIRLILVHPDLGNAAKLTAITQAVDQLAPPPGPSATGAQAAAHVGALLARNSGPATLLFEELAGEPIRIELTSTEDRPLTATECHDLRAPAGTRGYKRTGALRTVDTTGTAGTGSVTVAEVFSLVVPSRLPADACRTLGIPGPGDPAPPRSDVPLGKVLASLGVRREPLGARLVHGAAGPASGQGVAVEASARMWLGDAPVALAGERVTADFCQRVGGRVALAAG